MDAKAWIRDCEMKGANPYYEAVARGVIEAVTGDRLGVKEMRALARKMKRLGYHEIAEAAEKAGGEDGACLS